MPTELLAHRTLEAFAPRVAAALGNTRVAVVDGALAGFTVTKADEVEHVFVDATYRGTGVATQLLTDAAGLVRADGHPQPWLAVVTGNARAQRFYEREGWVDSGQIEYHATTGPDSYIPLSCQRMLWQERPQSS